MKYVSSIKELCVEFAFVGVSVACLRLGGFRVARELTRRIL
jgi:hypothetical protein